MEYTLTGDMAQDIYHLLSRSFMRLDAGDHQLMRKFGLTLTQSWALVHLGDEQGRSLTELAELLICDKSNVTSIVDKLENEELATRKRGKEGDRRYTRVVLTEKGLALRRAVLAARESMVKERLQTLDKREMEQLYASLERLVVTLTAQYYSDEEQRIIDHAFEQTPSFPIAQNS